jgi:hypothetical protein
MVGYRYSGGHFKQTGKAAPGGCLAWADPRGGGKCSKRAVDLRVVLHGQFH